MDKKDVAAISIAVAFNKKWWDNHRSSKIKGTGTGAMLDQWRKSNLAGKLSPDDLEKAYKDCDDLKKSLLAAKKLCDQKESEDEKGIDKMLDLLADHRSAALDKRKDTLDGFTATLKTATEEVEKLKPRLAGRTRETDVLQKRLQNAEAATKMDISEEDKKQLLKNVTYLRNEIEQLKNTVNLDIKELQSILSKKESKEKIKEIGFEKSMTTALEKFMTNFNSVQDLYNQLFNDVLGLAADCADLETDISGSATIDTTLKTVTQFRTMIINGQSFKAWLNLTELAREELPAIIDAKKNPAKVSPEGWKHLNSLVPQLDEGMKNADDAAPQIARLLKQAQKGASRFPASREIKDVVDGIQVAARERLAERAQCKKVVPPVLLSLKQILDARPD